MGRSKIPITWIKSDASRQVTFNKRKKGMKKKAEELAILCGVDVCMICFGPTITGSGKNQHNNQSLNSAVATTGNNINQPQSSAGSSSSSSANPLVAAVPFSWGMPGVSSVINKFEGLPKEERDKKKLDNTSLLEQQIKKLRRELKTKLDQNWKLEQERAYFELDERLECYTIDELKRLADCLLDKLRVTFERISYWEQHQDLVQPPASAEVDEFTSGPGQSKLVNSPGGGYLPLINPFVLPSQQSNISLNLNPMAVAATSNSQELRIPPGFMDGENAGLLPLGIGPSISSQMLSGNQVWNSSASEAVVTSTTYQAAHGEEDDWQQPAEECEAPLLHSMLLAIGESSDDSKPEQPDFSARMQHDEGDYL